MQPLKCMYCSTLTSSHKINVQKKINSKVVTLTNAPVYYCKPCDETFLASETLNALTYIKNGSLESKRILFEFEEINRKVSSDKSK